VIRNATWWFIVGFCATGGALHLLSSDSVGLILRDLADYYERAEELLAAVAMAGSVAFGVLGVAVRKGLVGW
jgi:hypothetical protein